MSLKKASRTRPERRKPRHEAPGVQYGFSVPLKHRFTFVLYVPQPHPGNIVSEMSAVTTADMRGVAELRIPLKVELKVGPNWAEMSGAA